MNFIGIPTSLNTALPLLWLALGLTACTDGDEFPDDATMIAVGDSFLDWNRDDGHSIPDVIGRQRGEVMGNASISGATVLGGDEFTIPNQYRKGPWSWVIINGGGNDITDRCDCRNCGATLNKLLTADGSSGALRDLAERAVSHGSKAVIVGYMNLLPQAAESPQCNDELAELRTRKSLMAADMQDVIYVNAAEALDGTDSRLYDDDNLHPSIAGSKAVGTLIANAIRQTDEDDATDTGATR